MRIISVQNLDYSIPIHTVYYPTFVKGTQKRIQRDNIPYKDVIQTMLNHPSIRNVWGIVLEKNGVPLFVAHNIACKVRSPCYRRVLFMKINDVEHHISDPIEYSRLNAECVP